MSWDISGFSIRAFFRTRHNIVIGIVACYILAAIIQLSGIGLLIVIAGVIGGFLVKNNLRAIIAAFLGGFLAWLTLFGVMFALNPQAFTNAWFMVGQTMPAPQLFVCLVAGVMTGVGGQLGSLFAEVAYPPAEDDLGLPPTPTERVPTEELPRRRRVKRKKKKKKRRS